MVKGKFPYEREEEFDPILYENQDEFEKQKLEQGESSLMLRSLVVRSL